MDANIYYDGADHLVIGDLTITNDNIYYKGKPLIDAIWDCKPDYAYVVRCRDCAYYRDSQWVIATDVPDVCTFFSDGVKVEPDGFCKWGKRREEQL